MKYTLKISIYSYSSILQNKFVFEIILVNNSNNRLTILPAREQGKHSPCMNSIRQLVSDMISESA